MKIIYDCNDNPLAFPNSSNKKKYFDKTLDYADKIIVPFKSYSKFIPEQYHQKIDILLYLVMILMDYMLERFQQKIGYFMNILGFRII